VIDALEVRGDGLLGRAAVDVEQKDDEAKIGGSEPAGNAGEGSSYQGGHRSTGHGTLAQLGTCG
jgi:hypothetical protein